MLQIENEYGYCGSDKAYLRHLLASARQQLGGNVTLFTTDPPDLAHLGSLPGSEVYTCALECSQRCEVFGRERWPGGQVLASKLSALQCRQRGEYT